MEIMWNILNFVQVIVNNTWWCLLATLILSAITGLAVYSLTRSFLFSLMPYLVFTVACGFFIIEGWQGALVAIVFPALAFPLVLCWHASRRVYTNNSEE